MRNYSIDTLKFLCAIFVIYIHTPSPEDWKAFIKPLTICAVPIFFMISGYMTYGKSNLNITLPNRIKYLSKIFIKVFLCFFVCSLIAKGEDSLNRLLVIFSHNFIIFNEVPFAGHLWYIAAYIYVLAIMLAVERFNLYKSLFIIAPILIIISLTFGKYSEIILGHVYPVHFTRSFLLTGLPFFTIGMMIKQIKKLPSKIVAIYSCILFYILGVIEVQYVYGHGDLFLSTVFMSISIFIIFLNVKQTTDNIFSRMGREDSLYIYLFHLFPTIILNHIADKIPYFPYYSAPLVFCLTMVLIKLLRKLKIIGRII